MKHLIGPKRFVAGCALACALVVAGTAVAASPANFVDEASAAGIAEIETSRMAIGKTSSTDIESYAVEMIKDHTDANRDLKELAQKHDLQVSTDEQILGKAKKLMLHNRDNYADLIDIGMVGDISQIHPALISHLEAGAFIPVIAPIGVGEEGETYNINADVVAGKIAEILKAEKLVLLTNTPGVLDKDDKLVTDVTPQQIDALVEDGTLYGGMLPKISSALEAARNGVKSVHIIDGRVEHALLLEILTSHGFGTMIKSS